MRKYIICIVSFIGAALLQTGCYDDKITIIMMKIRWIS